jgi:hypothetical protein
MKTHLKLALAVLAGLSIGVAGAAADSRAANEDATWLCHRGSRSNGPHYLTKIW